MVLSDFLSETRRRWLKAFKLFKRNRSRRSNRKVSPALCRSPSYSGTVDASSDIDLQKFCTCHISLSPLQRAKESYENSSYNSSCNSYGSSRNESLISYENESNFETARSDSAYDSARSSPSHPRQVCYATVTYLNVDSEDSSSIRTEYTLLDFDAEAENEGEEEKQQNLINESIEFISTL